MGLREISLHLLDIAENSVAAGAHTIQITIEEDLHNDRLKASIQDNGRGMDEQLLDLAFHEMTRADARDCVTD